MIARISLPGRIRCVYVSTRIQLAAYEFMWLVHGVTCSCKLLSSLCLCVCVSVAWFLLFLQLTCYPLSSVTAFPLWPRHCSICPFACCLLSSSTHMSSYTLSCSAPWQNCLPIISTSFSFSVSAKRTSTNQNLICTSINSPPQATCERDVLSSH